MLEISGKCLNLNVLKIKAPDWSNEIVKVQNLDGLQDLGNLKNLKSLYLRNIKIWNNFMEKIEEIENKIENFIADEKTKKLISILVNEKYDKKTIETLTKSINIYNESYNNLLLVSCIGYTTNWKYFPKKLISMLKGIHKYYNVYNVTYIPYFFLELKKLQKNGIEVMLSTEMAMYVYYDKKFPRDLNFFSIVVQKKDLLKVREYYINEDEDVAKKNNLNNLHISSSLIENEENFEDDWGWERAIKYNFQGIDFRIPKEEDMFVHYIEIASRRLVLDSSVEKRLRRLLDCYKIFKSNENFDKKYCLQEISKIQEKERMHLILILFSKLFENTFTKEEIEEYFPTDKKYCKYIKRVANYVEIYR